MPTIDDNGDVHLAADSRGDGIGSVILSTGGVERHRVRPDGTGTGSFSGAPAFAHNGTQPNSYYSQAPSGRIWCGFHTDGKNWSFNSGGLYQNDSLAAVNFRSKTLPANADITQGAKVVVYNSLSYLLIKNSVSGFFEVYSAPLVTGTNNPTWTGPLVQLSANATLIMTAFRVTSVGIFVGEYSAGSDITNGPSVWRSTDGSTFAKVLGPLGPTGTGTRHIHGVYEDPYNLGTIYVLTGDAFSPYVPVHLLYKSTDGGATFSALTNFDVSGGVGAWQGVGMGFNQNFVFVAGDQVLGGGAYYFDRTAQSPKWMTLIRHDDIAVPGGHGRAVVDMATTNASATVTSATAAFTAADIGRLITGPNTIADGSYITAVGSATSVTISQNATGTVSAQTGIIKDGFYVNAYAGAVDPASGWFYIVANDASNAGNVSGLFVITQPGGVPQLLRTFFAPTLANYELFIQSGFAWIARYGPIQLPVKTTV